MVDGQSAKGKRETVLLLGGKRSERVLRATPPKGASQVVFELMLDLNSWRVLCFPHSVTRERPFCISGFLIPDSSYNCID